MNQSSYLKRNPAVDICTQVHMTTVVYIPGMYLFCYLSLHMMREDATTVEEKSHPISNILA